jgi:hypothetical protein
MQLLCYITAGYNLVEPPAFRATNHDPLLLRVKDRALDHDSLLEMQGALQDYIRLLYSKGVAYTE